MLQTGAADVVQTVMTVPSRIAGLATFYRGGGYVHYLASVHESVALAAGWNAVGAIEVERFTHADGSVTFTYSTAVIAASAADTSASSGAYSPRG